MHLVAGGAGFLGEILTKKLLEKGNKVRSFDHNFINLQDKNLEVLQGNVLDQDFVNKALRGVDIVFIT